MNDTPGPISSNIAKLVMQAEVTFGDRPALGDTAETVSYAELAERTRSAAAQLTEIGILPGDRVAIVTDKQVDIVSWMFGCYLAGAVLVPVNPLLKARQVQHILSDSGARLLIASQRRTTLLDNLLDCPALKFTLPGLGAAAELHGPTAQLPNAKPAPDGFARPELATLFYTSGSTGLPKAVACTHENILSGAESVASYLENTADDVILAILPLSFDAGFSQLTTGFLSGAKVVLRNYLLPRDIARACEQEGVTGITGVPAIWTAALKANWQEDARGRLRYFANTGGHLPQERISQLMELFPNASPFPMYGLTEAFRSAYLPPDKVNERPGSMGRAIPGAQLFVLDENGEICAPDQPGELVHAGPTVALGYWNNPDETGRRFRQPPPALQKIGIKDHVVYSGDVVICDSDGFLYFRGRGDAQIKIAGNRISFAEIEDVALSLKGVRACAAGGRPALVAGSDPTLVLFFESDGADETLAEELDTHLRQELPSFMVPAEIIMMPALATNPNGKYDVKAMLQASATHGELATQEE